MLKIGTVFSGIGAIEHALKRMSIPHKIVFACDNGEVDLLKSDDEILSDLSRIESLSDRKNYVRSLIPPRRTNAVKKSYLANYEMDEEHYYHNVLI